LDVDIRDPLCVNPREEFIFTYEFTPNHNRHIIKVDEDIKDILNFSGGIRRDVCDVKEFVTKYIQECLKTTNQEKIEYLTNLRVNKISTNVDVKIYDPVSKYILCTNTCNENYLQIILNKIIVS
jgi:hypothetical protein